MSMSINIANDLPTFEIQVNGGLCSRLRAVLGAIGYCESQNKRLVINWPRYQPNLPNGFEARFSDIWEHLYEEIDDASTRSKDVSLLGHPGDVKFRTCHIDPFVPYLKEPVSSYMDRLSQQCWVDETISTCNHQFLDEESPIVGVVIRDEMPHTEPVDMTWHIDRMLSISKHKPVSFFICCGKPETYKTIEKHFNVFRVPKSFRYDKEGILHQAVELYMLPACHWILGAKDSSFSQLAALMSGATFTEGTKSKGGRYEEEGRPGDTFEAHFP